MVSSSGGKTVHRWRFSGEHRDAPWGKHAAVLHCGNGPHELIVIELPNGRIVSRAGVEEAFFGVTFSKDGTKLFCSGAGKELVNTFSFKDGYLFNHEEIRLRDVKERGIPSGIAATRSSLPTSGRTR
jgi:hypothetical protein